MASSGTSTANIWKFSIFRSIMGIFKGSPRTQRCYLVSEEGILRKIDLPMATGWASDMPNNLSWAVIHKLKVRIKTENGIENALFISDRSYIPLDPAGVLTVEERKRLIPLSEIAKSVYNKAESTCQQRTRTNNAHKLMQNIFYFSIVMTMVIVLIVLIKAHIK